MTRLAYRQSEVPAGAYHATYSGYEAEFKVGAVMYRATFSSGIRSFGYKHNITVRDTGEIYSTMLSAYATNL